MPKYQITSPDGRTFEVNAPEGATQQDALEYVQKTQPEKIDPTEGMTGAEKFFAGMGKGMVDMYRGGKQALGIGDQKQLQAEIDESRRLDKPLTNTGAGMVGNFAGMVAPAIPLAFVPGANTYAGSALIGAGMGALNPTSDDESRALNMVMGGAGGMVGKFAGDKGGAYVGKKLAELKSNKLAEQAAKAVKDETWQMARDAGYVVPPSAVKPSFVGNRLESLAGKAAVGQQASVRNQEVTNKLAAKYLGFADDVPVSPGTLDAFTKAQGNAYQRVGNLSDDAKQALELWKQSNYDKRIQFNYYNRSGSPEALAKAKAARTEADGWFNVLVDEAKEKGNPGLVDELKKARVNLAKADTVDRAMNKATGNVHADVFGRLYEKNPGLYKGTEAETIGRFASSYSPYARAGEKIPTPGVSKAEALAAGLMGITGAGMTGNVAGALLGTLPFLSAPARNFALSKSVQSGLNPNYSIPFMTRALPSLMNNRVTQVGLPLAVPAGLLAYSE